MKFKQFIAEMALHKNGYRKDVFSHKSDWELSKNDKKTKKIAENNNYIIYSTPDDIMYMTDKNNKYIGSIEYTINGKSIAVDTSHSSLKHGFYKNLFELLFKKYKEINSSHILSNNAFKAYMNLSKTYKIVIKDQYGNILDLPVTEENLFIDGLQYDRDKHDIETYYRHLSVSK